MTKSVSKPPHEVLDNLVVYVEDHEDDVSMLKLALKQARHRGIFAHAASVPDAEKLLLECVRAGTLPGVIFVDLRIHGADGREIISFIRAHEALRKVPTVVLTGSYAFDQLETAYEMGANLVMTKPPDLTGWTDLVLKVRDYFSPGPQ